MRIFPPALAIGRKSWASGSGGGDEPTSELFSLLSTDPHTWDRARGFDQTSGGRTLYRDDTAFDPGNGSFSVSFWLRVDANIAAMPISRGNQSPSSGGWSVSYATNGKLTLRTADGTHSASVTGPALALGRYYHVLLEIDRADDRLRGYLDGSDAGWTAAADLSAFGSISGAGSFLNLGSSPSQTLKLTGAIDELRFWSRTLTADERAAEAAGRLYSDLTTADKVSLVASYMMNATSASSGESDSHTGGKSLSEFQSPTITNGAVQSASTDGGECGRWANSDAVLSQADRTKRPLYRSASGSVESQGTDCSLSFTEPKLLGDVWKLDFDAYRALDSTLILIGDPAGEAGAIWIDSSGDIHVRDDDGNEASGAWTGGVGDISLSVSQSSSGAVTVSGDGFDAVALGTCGGAFTAKSVLRDGSTQTTGGNRIVRIAASIAASTIGTFVLSSGLPLLLNGRPLLIS